MKQIKQLTIILAVSLIAELMEYLIPLPVAGSVYGLVLMLIGLITHIIPLQKVEGVADFLVENMSVVFIPPTVGIMASIEQLRQILIPLIVISLVSTVFIMGITGRVTQFIIRHTKSAEEIVSSDL